MVRASSAPSGRFGRSTVISNTPNETGALAMRMVTRALCAATWARVCRTGSPPAGVLRDDLRAGGGAPVEQLRARVELDPGERLQRAGVEVEQQPVVVLQDQVLAVGREGAAAAGQLRGVRSERAVGVH